jgi:hypothetical protein
VWSLMRIKYLLQCIQMASYMITISVSRYVRYVRRQFPQGLNVHSVSF